MQSSRFGVSKTVEITYKILGDNVENTDSFQNMKAATWLLKRGLTANVYGKTMSSCCHMK